MLMTIYGRALKVLMKKKVFYMARLIVEKLFHLKVLKIVLASLLMLKLFRLENLLFMVKL